MGKATGWEDRSTHLRVWIDIPLRKNGLPNIAAARAVEAYLDAFNPDAFDPPEPVPELVARAALRDLVRVDGVEHMEITADDPPLPDFGIPLLDAGLLPDDDEIIFPRACPAGGCGDD